MTADTLGGVFTYAIELARALAGHGVRVALATMGGPLGASQRREAEAVPGLTVIESDYRLEWMDDPWEDLSRAGAWLLGLEQRIRPEIVHVNGFVHAALPFRAPTVAVAHSCVLSWWSAVRGEEAPPRYDRYRQEVRAGLAAAGAVIAPTRAMLDAAARYHGPFERSFVIPNAAQAGPRGAVPKENLVLSAGRLWDDAKNVAALGHVAARLPWPVVALGSDEHPDQGRRSIPGVRALGVLGRAEVTAWMARAAIYALPARYEPFGLSALEAALEGCALVLGDVPSLREVWGDAALFVDPEDPGALERALHLLIEDGDLRRARALAARTRALAYTPERMVLRYLEVYDELLEGARGIEAAREASCA